MVQRREHPRLALEAREAIRVGRELGRQDLDRDVAPELRVARAIHLAHAARADEALDAIACADVPDEIRRERADFRRSPVVIATVVGNRRSVTRPMALSDQPPAVALHESSS